MNRHADLPDAGLHTHFDIDQQLPEPHEKDALVGTLNTPSAANEFVTADDLAQHVEPLRGYETISGVKHWEYDGIDGTARTVIADGAGDVVHASLVFYVLRASNNYRSAGDTGLLVPGSTIDLWNSGADICVVAVSAGGAMTVQRTAGTLTYKVALWVLWI